MSIYDEFKPVLDGHFLARDGAARSTTNAYSNKKLCFTATDKEFLAALLYNLSLRPECYFVKLTAEPREGMYLGRCFAVDDDTAARWWREFKPHPRMMCNLQDDDFVEKYRAE